MKSREITGGVERYLQIEGGCLVSWNFKFLTIILFGDRCEKRQQQKAEGIFFFWIKGGVGVQLHPGAVEGR